jgi:hypothetical protein
MLANAIDRILAQAGQKRTRDVAAAEVEEVRETVIIYDYDPIIDTGAIWRATLPLSELFKHLGPTCRYIYDNAQTRPIGAALGGLAAGGFATLCLWTLVPIAMAAILGAMFGGPLGAMAGWIMAVRFTPKPIWMVRRIWAQIPPDDQVGPLTTGYNGGDTYLDGDWERTVVPLPHTHLKGPPTWPHLLNVAAEPTAQSGELAGLTPLEENPDVYKPVVDRGTTLYQMLQQLVTKRRLARRNMSTWEKVQTASVTVLALGVVGLLIFVMLLTEDHAPPPEVTAWLMK